MPSPTIYFDFGETLITGPSNNRQPFPDAVATLQELHSRGYLLGLLSDQASATTVADVVVRLNNFGFGPYIGPVTISSELPGNIRKPDAQIFALALQKSGHVAASSETIFITETLGHIQAARALGWRAILKTNGGPCLSSFGECVSQLDDFLALLPPLNIDLWLRDANDHSGSNFYSGSRFWDSPDLWIRNDDDGGTSHQPPEFGQDNQFYARVRNRGDGIARSAQITFAVKPWAGTNFVYPNDYMPSIASATISDLAPGDSQVVKALWPSSQVPPAGTHACWISAIHTDRDEPTNNRRVWQHNNLAQKNLTVVDLVAGDWIAIPFRIGHRLKPQAEAVRIELRRPKNGLRLKAQFVSVNGRTIEAMWNAGLILKPSIELGNRETAEELSSHLEVLSATPVRVKGEGSRDSTYLNLASGSRIRTGNPVKAPKVTALKEQAVNARLAQSKNGSVIDLSPGPISGFTTVARAHRNESLGLRLQAPIDSQPGDVYLVDVVERDTDNKIVGGISVLLRIKS